jgi:hypothetical protein
MISVFQSPRGLRNIRFGGEKIDMSSCGSTPEPVVVAQCMHNNLIPEEIRCERTSRPDIPDTEVAYYFIAGMGEGKRGRKWFGIQW